MQKKIDPYNVISASDRELTRLGVATIGDRIRLRDLCSTEYGVLSTEQDKESTEYNEESTEYDEESTEYNNESTEYNEYAPNIMK